jgi:hypothetical protein
MSFIVEFFEKIQKKQNSYIPFNIYRNYTYLNKYSPEQLLIVGGKTHPKYNTTNDFKLDTIKKHIDKYSIFVLDKYVCSQSNKSITELLDYFKKNNKDVIFVGYTTYINLNINNNNEMFRPIDITKYPFNVKNTKVIHKAVSIKLLILFVLCITTITIGNYRDPRILYKITLLLLLLSPLGFPSKKVLFIKNKLN